MASGTPVVTSNVSSLPEVAGDAAVLVDPYDAGRDRRRHAAGADRPALRGGAAPQRASSGRASSRGSAPVRARLRRGLRSRSPIGSDRDGASAESSVIEGRARPRLADRHARRREGARGAVRALPRRRHSSRWSTSAARCRRASSGTASTRRSCSGCPMAGRYYRAYLPLFPTAIEQFDLDGYDLVISCSHCAAKVGRSAGPRRARLLLPLADALCVGSVRCLLRPGAGRARSAAAAATGRCWRGWRAGTPPRPGA